MTNKTEVMKDLKFCQELMDRLVEFADKHYINKESLWECNHTVLQNDIIRLRRELNEVRRKLDK